MFVLAGVPAGSGTLRFRGGADDATLRMEPVAPGEHRVIAVDVSGRTATVHHGDVQFHGTIDHLDAPRLVVAGHLVLTSAETVITRGDAAADFASLEIGELAEIEGQLAADGSVLARTVHVPLEQHDAGVSEAVHLEGHLAAKDGSILTVVGTAVAVTDSTAIVRNGLHATVADLVVGDDLSVDGIRTGEHAVTATSIQVLVVATVTIEVHGAVTAIGPHGFTVAGAAILVDEHTSWSGVHDPHGLADLHVGDEVTVEGIHNADGSVQATHVYRSALAPSDVIHFSGLVEAVGEADVAVSGHHFAVDANTVVKHGDTVLTLGDLHHGEAVDVTALARSGGLTPLATLIEAHP